MNNEKSNHYFVDHKYHYYLNNIYHTHLVEKDHKEIGLIGMLNAKLFVLYLIIAVVLFIILTIVILRKK